MEEIIILVWNNFYNEIKVYYELGYNERDADEIAEEWLSNNIVKVRRWLSLVETKDGRDAYEVLKEELGIE